MITCDGSIGGGPEQLRLLCKELANKINITIATPIGDSYNLLKEDGFSSSIINIQQRAINIKDLTRLAKKIRHDSIDIIHSHGKAAGVLGRLLSLFTSVPVIHTHHGIHVSGFSRSYRFIYLFYERIFNSIEKKTIYVSNSEKDAARKLRIYRPEKSMVIYNGVNSYISPLNKKQISQSVRKTMNTPLDKITVITLCRFDKVKNIDEIIRISELCPELMFWIIGDGPSRNLFIDKLKLQSVENIVMPGFIKDKMRYLVSADIYLSTSIREGHPISILEAMSLAMPIVASNVAGNCETFTDKESGFLYKLGDIVLASRLLKELSRNPSLRIEMGEAAKRKQKEHFSSNSMSQKYMALYSSLLN